MRISRQVPMLPARKRDAHKGDFGHVLVVAGAEGYVGAAALASDAALRVGAGLVTLAAPRAVYPILAAKLTGVMVQPVPSTAEGTCAVEAEHRLRELQSRATVRAVGPGLTAGPAVSSLLRVWLPESGLPTVVDADAINCLGTDLGPLMNNGAPVILTPHPGEMARLTSRPVPDIQRNRAEIAHEFARRHKCVLVLKGARTVVSDGDRLFTNPSGNPGMATAGSGDVLCGIIAGLIAQGLGAFESAQLGVYLHGLAGDIAASQVTEQGVIATDLIDFLPAAFVKQRGALNKPPPRED
ncbi:MAG: NAD(P)H-hydrate dehydratase [Planctomycetes bacterium]|nr:NAD(P)H-hydrate dehydratase [Planctomycetota bacterium]